MFFYIKTSYKRHLKRLILNVKWQQATRPRFNYTSCNENRGFNNPETQGVCPTSREISAVIPLLTSVVFFFALGQSLKKRS
jgi:hypothetical protein